MPVTTSFPVTASDSTIFRGTFISCGTAGTIVLKNAGAATVTITANAGQWYPGEGAARVMAASTAANLVAF